MAISNALLATIVVNLLATTGDITLSWTSPVYPILYSNDTAINPLQKPITPGEDSILGSILNLGAVLGPIPFRFITASYGLKAALLLLGLPHIVSFLTMAFAKNIHVFYFARFIAGISEGAGYSLIPLYIGEIAKDSNRGAMVLTMNIFWSIGNCLPLLIGPYLSITNFNLILTAIPVAFMILFWKIGTESPYALVKMNKYEEAEKTLLYLRTKNEGVKEEMEKIKEFVKMEETGRFLDVIADRGQRKSFFICVFLLATQDLGGFCSITYHLQLIFQTANTNLSPELSALIVGIAIFVSSFIAPFLVDRLGRRPLIIMSCAGMSLSLAILGMVFYLQYNLYDMTSFNWLPIFSLILYILSFNFGIGTVPWTLVSELFSDANKQVISSMCSSFCWVTTFVVTLSYNGLNEYLGIYSTFWLFSGWCLLATIVSAIFVPETKAKSFSEIQKMLYGVTDDLRMTEAALITKKD